MGKLQKKIGAILRNVNHRWFNRLSKQKQAEINKLFQAYKRNYEKCNVEFVDNLDIGVEVAFTDFQVYDQKKERKDKYERTKKKEQDRKDIERGMGEWEKN